MLIYEERTEIFAKGKIYQTCLSLFFTWENLLYSSSMPEEYCNFHIITILIKGLSF